jgi:Zn-finger nucleic acid-binding protein
MNCPVCGERLREVERSGVVMDMCPSCKGTWLDRGAIDRIVAAERGAGAHASVAPRESGSRERGSRDDDHNHDHDRDHDDRDDTGEHERGALGQGGKPAGKRRGSFLQDIMGGLGGD